MSATFAHNSKSVKIDDETVAVSFVGKTGKQTFSHGCRASKPGRLNQQKAANWHNLPTFTSVQININLGKAKKHTHN